MIMEYVSGFPADIHDTWNKYWNLDDFSSFILSSVRGKMQLSYSKQRKTTTTWFLQYIYHKRIVQEIAKENIPK